jgi:hypothetical protein
VVDCVVFAGTDLILVVYLAVLRIEQLEGLMAGWLLAGMFCEGRLGGRFSSATQCTIWSWDIKDSSENWRDRIAMQENSNSGVPVRKRILAFIYNFLYLRRDRNPPSISTAVPLRNEPTPSRLKT